MQQIPMARIKRAMKDATDVKAVSAEASYLVARATVRPRVHWSLARVLSVGSLWAASLVPVYSGRTCNPSAT